MHIKRIQISGFKSYKDAVTIEDFSSGHNAVVGRNGTGKSNFFSAIQFVLGEKEYSNLTLKERQDLLHEGAGANVMTAFVEIVFDNTDGRLPVDAEEVVLRRTIGLKKDEYFLNRKHVPKSDVVNLLESAGFSRSNPYFIVKQGKINALSTMKPREQFELIKEVAGTTVYEERRKESLAIMQETSQKREQIQEGISYIDERLKELNQEKEELQQFRILDRDRKGMEYVLFDKELLKTGHQLEALEKSRNDEVILSHELSQTLEEVSENLESHEKEMQTLTLLLQRTEREIAQADEDKAQAIRLRAKSELRVRDLEEQSAVKNERLDAIRAQLALIQKEIDETQKNLDDIVRKDYEEKKKIYTDLASTVKSRIRRREELHSKQGRSAQFSSQNERDAWLQGEIDKIQRAMTSRQSALKDAQLALEKQVQELNKLELKEKEMEKEYKSHSDALAQSEDEIQSLKKKKEQLTEQRKELWRTEQEHDAGAKLAQEESERFLKALKATMPHSVSQGLDAVSQIAKEMNLMDKVYGPIFKLIKAKRAIYNTAIEVAAQGQLLHVVVEDDKVASKLMAELQRRRAGRVTFKPLNQMRPKDMPEALVEYLSNSSVGVGSSNRLSSDSNTEDNTVVTSSSESDVSSAMVSKLLPKEKPDADAYPLISKVQFDPKFEPAIRVALDNILLCRNHQIAAEFSRKFDVNCVTLEGDEVNRRGALTGGFYDTKKSRLAAAAAMRNAQIQLDSALEIKEKANLDAKRCDQQITQIVGELDMLGTKRNHLRASCSSLVTEKKHIAHQVEKLKDSLESDFKNPLEKVKAGLTELEEQVSTFQAELSEPMLGKLTSEEQEELAKIKSDMEDLQRQEIAAKDAVDASKVRVKSLETELKNNLLCRKRELEAELERGGGIVDSSSSSSHQAAGGNGQSSSQSSDDMIDSLIMGSIALALEAAKSELETHDRALEDVRQRQEDLGRLVAERRKRHRELQNLLDEGKSKESELSEQLSQAKERVEKVLAKRTFLLQRREAASQKIRELGSLPQAELEKYREMNPKQLMSAIKEVNDELKKYSHVNKKALDQFISFSDQRESLLEREVEAEKAASAIKSLMDHLDAQKDEAIRRTFKGVSKHFREVFKELVPRGKGDLHLHRKMDEEEQQEDNDDSNDDDDENHHKSTNKAISKKKVTKKPDSVEKFSGISPKVSFNGTDEVVSMNKLSGGQKALVALALIFAIQRCDPAPFYLFDEIDQALDATHRAAVARIIHHQASDDENPAQFITVTFRPELVEHADKCFGIQFQGKVSRIEPIDTEVALDFIQKQNTEEVKGEDSATTSKVIRKQQGKSSKRKNYVHEEEMEEEEDNNDSGEEKDDDDDDVRSQVSKRSKSSHFSKSSRVTAGSSDSRKKQPKATTPKSSTKKRGRGVV